MGYETLILEIKEGVALVTLNRPPYNPLSPTLYRELFLLCEQLERDKDAKVAVFTGGGKAFSSGLDVKEVEGKSSVQMREIVDLARKA
ncbi:MAG: enoyl-CoA hydratase/isomerase family protein, partial [Deltaproteobacteria bacterium]